jgi:hypothetical protein
VAHGPASPGRRRVAGRKIEEEDLNGHAEVVEVREALEHLQVLSLEVSEELDAYQQRYAC